MATDEPPQVYHKGIKLDLTPYEGRLLLQLVRFGKSSKDALVAVSMGEDVENADSQLKVLVSRVRKALPPGIRINPVWGWGYELLFE